jgi:hypothetical protein
MAGEKEPRIVSDPPTIDPRGDLLWERSPGENDPNGLIPPYPKPHHESGGPPPEGPPEPRIVDDVETIDPRGDLLWEKSPGVNEPQGLVPPYPKPHHDQG